LKPTIHPQSIPQQRHVSPAATTGAVLTVSLLGAVVVAGAAAVVVSTVSTVAGGEVPSCGVAAAAEAAEAVGEVIYISVAID